MPNLTLIEGDEERTFLEHPIEEARRDGPRHRTRQAAGTASADRSGTRSDAPLASHHLTALTLELENTADQIDRGVLQHRVPPSAAAVLYHLQLAAHRLANTIQCPEDGSCLT